MSLLSKIKDAIRLYQSYEAAYPLELAESFGEKAIRIGGTGMAINMGNWVNSPSPGNLYSNWGGSVYFSGSHLDYATKVGALYNNSAYLACLGAYQDAFAQAPVCIKQMQSDGSKVILPDHELMQLFEMINEDDDSITLLDATLIDYIGKGNAYWLVTPDRLGNPRVLNYLPASRIKPVTAQTLGRMSVPGEPPILYYEYFPTSTPERIEREELIHIRMGKDPEAPYMGLGRGDKLLREIFADNEGTNYTGSILYQMGVAQRILQPKTYKDGDREMVAPFDGQQITQQLAQHSTGDNRGQTVAIESLFEIHESDSSPEKMALDKIRQYPESRVCAVTRVPAKVANLLIGEATSTFANYAEARESFWQDSVLPNMRRIRSQVTRQLVWRNEKYKARNIWFGFDYSEVPALQIDEQARDKNVRENFKYGLIDAAEARAVIGLEPKPEDEGRMYAAPNQPAPADGSLDATQGQITGKAFNPLSRILEEIEALESLNGDLLTSDV